MSKIDTVFNRIFSVFKGIQVICIFGISGLVFLQVILREVFLIGVQWVYEWSCFMQVTLVWLGMPILLYSDKLLSVTALYNTFPTIIKRVLDVLRYLILLCCTGFMTYGYVLYVKNLGIMKSPVVGLNCTPFVRQYDILSKKWGVLLCQKEYQTNDIRRSSREWL